MFVQVIEAGVRDAEGLRRQWDRWNDQLASGAAGWVGSTAGISTQGRFILAARFESEEAARANSDRPEQGEWWSETAEALVDPAFVESTDYRAFGDCTDDQIGFVQMMRARISDRSRLEEIEDGMEAEWAEFRPDLLGGYRIWLPDGQVVAVDYFTSEEEARAGESKQLPDHLAAEFKEWQNLAVDVAWFDLPDPWLATGA